MNILIILIFSQIINLQATKRAEELTRNIFKTMDYANKIVVIYYYEYYCKACKDFNRIFDNLSENYDNINFYRLDINLLSTEEIKYNVILKIPEIDVIVDGFKIRYLGEYDYDSISLFINNIINKKLKRYIISKDNYKNQTFILKYFNNKIPNKIKYLNKIIDEDIIINNNKYFINKFKLNLTKNDRKNYLYLYRNYDNKVIKIKIKDNSHVKIKNNILKHSYPTVVELNENNIDWLFKHHINSLLYFTLKNVNERHINNIKNIIKNDNKLLILFIVKEGSKYYRRMKEFFDSIDSTDLFILKYDGKINKYKHIDAFEEFDIKQFLRNYSANRLKRFEVNEEITVQKIGFLMNFNSYYFNIFFNNKNDKYLLIYLYGSDAQDLVNYYKILDNIKDNIKNRTQLIPVILNAYKNEFNNIFIKNLPALIIKTPDNNLYKLELDITEKNIEYFINLYYKGEILPAYNKIEEL